MNRTTFPLIAQRTALWTAALALAAATASAWAQQGGGGNANARPPANASAPVPMMPAPPQATQPARQAASAADAGTMSDAKVNKHRANRQAESADWAPHQLQTMTDTLKLSSDQQAKVKVVLQDEAKQIAAMDSDPAHAPLRKERKARLAGFRDASDVKLQAILTPAQMTQWKQVRDQPVARSAASGTAQGSRSGAKAAKGGNAATGASAASAAKPTAASPAKAGAAGNAAKPAPAAPPAWAPATAPAPANAAH